ncbi:MAG: hypothetical protein HY508_13590 [Acidobacteria bacterium]|nr:hypothetical protein [Acidobacteriota bacterium]
MSFITEFVGRFGIFGEFLEYLWHRKLWWLIPLAMAILLVGILLVIGQASSVGPFIYTLF